MDVFSENGMDKGFAQVKDMLSQAAFPAKEMQSLTGHIQRAIYLMENPKVATVVHHHYAPKVVWISKSWWAI
jgi:hypothetical protein